MGVGGLGGFQPTQAVRKKVEGGGTFRIGIFRNFPHKLGFFDVLKHFRKKISEKPGFWPEKQVFYLMLKEAETLIESGAFKTKKSITKINASRIPSL